MSETTPLEHVNNMARRMGDMINEDRTWIDIFAMINMDEGSWKVIAHSEHIEPPFYVVDLDIPDYFIAIEETEDGRFAFQVLPTPDEFIEQIEPA